MDSDLQQAMVFLLTEMCGHGNKRQPQWTKDTRTVHRNDDGDISTLHLELQAILMMMRVVGSDSKARLATRFCQKSLSVTETKVVDSVVMFLEDNRRDACKIVIDQWCVEIDALPHEKQERKLAHVAGNEANPIPVDSDEDEPIPRYV